MITVRRSQDRGHFDHGWLSTYHTFSFADYYDPKQMGFRDLRVINEDYVQPGKGFPTHSHQDMEIITYIVEGALEHKDSMGNTSVIQPGEVQRMSAGLGVTHSEFNSSQSDSVHLLQIWVLPQKRGLNPSYEQKKFPKKERQGKLQLLVSPDGRENSVSIYQDVDLYAAQIFARDEVFYPISEGRHVWIQLIEGKMQLGDELIEAGDGVAVSNQKNVQLIAKSKSHLLLFDLA